MDIVFNAFGFACFLSFFEFGMTEGNILEPYKNWLYTLPLFFAKPLGLCIYCFAFWFFLFAYFTNIYVFFCTFGYIFISIKILKKWQE